MKIILIIPAYNEEENLPKLLNEIRLSGYNAIVVNDASTDNTAGVAIDAGFPVLSLPVNLGIGGAVQTGFLYAKRNNYEIAVQIDGDGQHDPRWIPKVVAPIEEGEADCVIGSRYLPDAQDGNYKTPYFRRLGMRFSSSILKLATGIRIYDTTSGFRALNRAAFSFFAQEYPVDHPEAEALFLLHKHRFIIKEIPVMMRYRENGESIFSFLRATLYPLRVTIGFAGLVFKKTGITNS